MNKESDLTRRLVYNIASNETEVQLLIEQPELSSENHTS